MVFRFPKSLDPITLFHASSLPQSTRALTILKQAQAQAASSSTLDQASDASSHAHKQRGEFTLEVTTDLPTNDQLRNIIDYAGQTGVGVKPSDVVKGAKDAGDALKRFKEDGGVFVRPITVDWNGGKAVVGDNESEILKMVQQWHD